MFAKRVSITLAAVAIAAAAASGCSSSHSHVPHGFQLLASVNGAMVYGQLQGRDVALIIDQQGTTVCNSKGPLTADHAPAVCDGHAGNTYVYAIPVGKDAPATFLEVCSANGQRSTLTRITTPASWGADLGVRIDPNNAGSYTGCS